MRENNGVHEYIASYVDDLCVVAKDPKEITDNIQVNTFFRKS